MKNKGKEKRLEQKTWKEILGKEGELGFLNWHGLQEAYQWIMAASTPNNVEERHNEILPNNCQLLKSEHLKALRIATRTHPKARMSMAALREVVNGILATESCRHVKDDGPGWDSRDLLPYYRQCLNEGRVTSKEPLGQIFCIHDKSSWHMRSSCYILSSCGIRFSVELYKVEGGIRVYMDGHYYDLTRLAAHTLLSWPGFRHTTRGPYERVFGICLDVKVPNVEDYLFVAGYLRVSPYFGADPDVLLPVLNEALIKMGAEILTPIVLRPHK